ncbi:hypothetical protein R3P38DRAFT_3023382 [Favolaschia claudopus]|uniref:Uncharacterized protein n=1 Tax=Favolaschia claudopus TaxID=2862362 RepID=A0AAW0AHW2_9AGAR
MTAPSSSPSRRRFVSIVCPKQQVHPDLSSSGLRSLTVTRPISSASFHCLLHHLIIIPATLSASLGTSSSPPTPIAPTPSCHHLRHLRHLRPFFLVLQLPSFPFLRPSTPHPPLARSAAHLAQSLPRWRFVGFQPQRAGTLDPINGLRPNLDANLIDEECGGVFFFRVKDKDKIAGPITKADQRHALFPLWHAVYRRVATRRVSCPSSPLRRLTAGSQRRPVFSFPHPSVPYITFHHFRIVQIT